ncbi:MAG: MASE1 domain-containing protein [Acidobacteria bacterium]|nr:MASE1 domain-containing protein [Acidobacteriota bacterium]MDA1235668.1 MASE1 domain-containing protein [Acidobacteriota bacterium]
MASRRGGSSAPDFQRLGSIALLAALYAAAGVIALEHDSAIGRIVWPSSGIALAALATGGRGLWPGVALGAALTTYFSGGGLVYVLATAIGNVLEAWTAVYLLDRWKVGVRFDQVRNVVIFVGISLLTAFLSSVCGIFGMFVADIAPQSALLRIGGLWILGHAMGTLVLAPFLLTAHRGLAAVRSEKRWIEALLAATALVVVGMEAFARGAEAPLEYLPFPLLIWAAYRFGPPGAAAANLVVSGIALGWTAAAQGPFAVGSTTSNHLLTWIYANVTAVTTMLLAAVVSQGKRAEAARRLQETEYRQLIEQAVDGVLIFEADGVCRVANSSVSKMTGYPAAELLGRNLSSLVEPQTAADVTNQVWLLQETESATFDWRLLRRDGTVLPAEVSAKRLDDGRLLAFVRDVTERRSLEAQLLQSQKMEAIGMLAGGVAHEFNNILTIIQSHSEVARDTLPAGALATEAIDYVIAAGDRAARLTRRLLAFARKQPAEFRVVSLNDLVSDVGRMLPRFLGDDIEYSTSPSSETYHVRVDPGQLEQVIINMALNARDAMPRGGRLTLECSVVQLRSGETGVGAELRPGEYVALRISDSGAGMDAATQSRIFEPFFTTKNRAEGSGLGLAVSYGIVKQAGGGIRVRSAPGDGSTFEVLLPRAVPPAAPKASKVGRDNGTQIAGSARSASRPRREQVLLIEDEACVLYLAAGCLREQGYDLLLAHDGEEALRIAREHPGAIDLIVSAVVMPGLSGPETVRRLRALHARARVIYVSGYADSRITAEELKHVGTGFLAKPFKPSELAAAVRAILDDGK